MLGYLPRMTTRPILTLTCPNLEIEDLVCLLEDFTSRGLWPVRRVQSTIKESGNQILSNINYLPDPSTDSKKFLTYDMLLPSFLN